MAASLSVSSPALQVPGSSLQVTVMVAVSALASGAVPSSSAASSRCEVFIGWLQSLKREHRRPVIPAPAPHSAPAPSNAVCGLHVHQTGVFKATQGHHAALPHLAQHAAIGVGNLRTIGQRLALGITGVDQPQAIVAGLEADLDDAAGAGCHALRAGLHFHVQRQIGGVQLHLVPAVRAGVRQHGIAVTGHRNAAAAAHLRALCAQRFHQCEALAQRRAEVDAAPVQHHAAGDTGIEAAAAVGMAVAGAEIGAAALVAGVGVVATAALAAIARQAVGQRALFAQVPVDAQLLLAAQAAVVVGGGGARRVGTAAQRYAQHE
ncbi:hypothetical protein G6F31_014913 [Rhizopus arrhizus]|nr:hypothetical protein G6F31_014913 [Rhizopus arrhizus]